jgi:hypothetical protein
MVVNVQLRERALGLVTHVLEDPFLNYNLIGWPIAIGVAKT